MGERFVVLGGNKYPIGKFRLRTVSEISVLLKQVGGEVTTQPAAAARETLIWKAMCDGGYSEPFDQFQNLKGVTLGELVAANLEVGRAIGYYAEEVEKTPPGEDPGDQGSPSAT